MTQMILSNCVGIMSMRQWIWPGEKNPKDRSTRQSGWRPGAIQRKAGADWRDEGNVFPSKSQPKSYSFLLKKLRDGDNVGRDDYPVTTRSVFETLICTGGGICGNQQLSDYENREGSRGRQHKERMGHTFTQHKGGTEDNTTLVPGKDGTNLNSTCYNCRKPCHLEYNWPEAGCKGICSLLVKTFFTEANPEEWGDKQQLGTPVHLLIGECYKMHLWKRMSENATQRENCRC